MTISRIIGIVVVLIMIIAGILKLLILIPFKWIAFAIGLYITLAILEFVFYFFYFLYKAIKDQWQSRN